ncbi:type II toxin-antitoxin system PemK/MazF family toxin [Bounagaea algeriensis]
MSHDEFAAGTVWFADLDPIRGHEQAGDRPVLIVSSAVHLALTGGELVAVLPMTTRVRPGWLHHVQLSAGGCVMTEQVRTLARERFRRRAPELDPDGEERAEVRAALTRMIDL